MIKFYLRLFFADNTKNTTIKTAETARSPITTGSIIPLPSPVAGNPSAETGKPMQSSATDTITAATSFSLKRPINFCASYQYPSCSPTRMTLIRPFLLCCAITE